jgi:hypothetical protein
VTKIIGTYLIGRWQQRIQAIAQGQEMTVIVPNTQWMKAQKDGFTQGVGFAKASTIFLCEQGLERILSIPLIL